MTPRAYQRFAVDVVIDLLRAGHSPLLVAPTGSGKTAMGSMIVRELGWPTIWVAHRDELVDQARAALAEFGIDASLHMAGRPLYAVRTVHVGSVARSANRPLAGKRLVVVDEAHHAAANTYLRHDQQYRGVPKVGLTATPFRLDGRGLGDAGYTHLVVAAYADDLAAAGHLVEPKVYAPPPVDLSGLRVGRGGDYDDDQLAGRFDRPKLVGDVVETWRAHADGYRTIVFACNVAHSRHLAEAFRSAGVAAEHVDGDTPMEERREKISRFKADQYMQLPPWLAAIRDGMAAAIKPDDLQAVMAAQVEKAKSGDVRAATFVMDQAHKLLAAEQRRPITITQTNNYYEGEAVPPEVPLKVEPHEPAALKRAASRVANGLRARLPGDRRIHEELRVDSDEAEKELRRRQAEAEEAASTLRPPSPGDRLPR